MTSDDFEKLGVFYLGKPWDPDAARTTDAPLLYDAKHLTTHAVIVGMTGSGKTGLAVALLEEAALDGVPAIVIDPKGDLANLLLAFPELRPDDFRPWLDEDEARREGASVDELAARTAERWRKGLAEWGEDGARVGRFRAAVDATVYTPGARAGVPLALLRSFAAPPPAVRSEPDLLRERVVGAVSALLGLLGIDADPLRSRETILLGNLLERAWSEGRDVDLAGLVHDVSSPPFDRIGAFDLEAFFPAKDRTALALALNGLLASPGFAAWTEGEPIDVGRLLYAPDGRPRLSIVSIAHLPDAERMFCVTVLLNEIVAWTRAQPGTSSLRAIVYMDEIFGYFPPTAAPSSKRPMLTLLKQARAFGVGVVLATQNPVDLDYKGLANAGTWFIGRLQTERDKLRVLDGLEGALAASGRAADRASLDRSLSGLGNRVFLMNDVHGHAPVMFQSRWALSYLRGPLTREQIKRLTEARGGAVSASPVKAAPTAAPADDALEPRRPIAGEGVVELFVPPAQSGGELVYRPTAFASARVRYANGRLGVDRVDAVALLAPLAPGDTEPGWSAAEPLGEATAGLEKQPRPDARFARTPGAALRKAEHDRWRRSFVQHVLEHCPIVLLESARLGETSRPGEDEPAFRRRLAELARERRDAAVEALRRRYAPKVAALQERIRRAEERVDAERAEADRQGWDTAVSAGVSILGAVLGGGRRRSLGGARTTLRSATRAAKERDDVARAEAQLAADRERLATLESELEADFRKLAAAHDVAGEPLARIELRPKKADVSVGTIALAWVPWRRDGETWVRA